MISFARPLELSPPELGVLKCSPNGPMLAVAAPWVAYDPMLRCSVPRRLRFDVQVPAAGNRTRLYRLGKRTCDLLGAMFFLTLFSPLMLSTLAALTITTRGKPIFTQVREGYRGRRFRMLKFRTMVLDAEKRIAHVKNESGSTSIMFKNRQDPRITRFGRFLRAFSIDETPQLVNVLLGHMSLVGPRPMVAGNEHKYDRRQIRRLSVKPGLTGLWQVSGRTNLGFQQMIDLDLRYIESQSLRSDIKLLAQTPVVVLLRRGAC